MCSWAERRLGPCLARALGGLVATVVVSTAFGQTPRFEGIGRPATPAEVKAWDIDVRPDFKGLPKGSGTVARGMELWEAQCAGCHGVFGESNETFTPLIGGTTAADVKSGRAARLRDEGFPQRTTMMKLSSLSTLWDYIHRAMPWNAPKSLSADDTYALTAFMLNLGGVVPDNFTLSDTNMREVQGWLPNRAGKTTAHALWPGRGLGGSNKPDVQGSRCMSACTDGVNVASALPEHARNAHGNLAEQNRLVGAQVGAETTRAASVTPAARNAAVTTPITTPTTAPTVQALLQQHNCLACHGVDRKVLGPALREVATRHASRPDLAAYLERQIVAGSTGLWGQVPMPAQSLPAVDAARIAQWLASGAR